MLQQKTCHIEYHSSATTSSRTSKSTRCVSLNGMAGYMRSCGPHLSETSEFWLSKGYKAFRFWIQHLTIRKTSIRTLYWTMLLGFSTTIPSPSKSDFPLNRHDISRRALGERPEVHQIKERIDHTYHENVRLVRCETLGSFLRSRRGIAGTRRDA